MHISGFNIIMVNNFISILLPFFLPLPPQTPLARSTLGPNSGWYQEVKRNIQNKALFCSTEKRNDKIHVSNTSFKKLRVICNWKQKAYLHNWGYRLATCTDVYSSNRITAMATGDPSLRPCLSIFRIKTHNKGISTESSKEKELQWRITCLELLGPEMS